MVIFKEANPISWSTLRRFAHLLGFDLRHIHHATGPWRAHMRKATEALGPVTVVPHRSDGSQRGSSSISWVFPWKTPPGELDSVGLKYIEIIHHFLKMDWWFPSQWNHKNPTRPCAAGWSRHGSSLHLRRKFTCFSSGNWWEIIKFGGTHFQYPCGQCQKLLTGLLMHVWTVFGGSAT